MVLILGILVGHIACDSESFFEVNLVVVWLDDTGDKSASQIDYDKRCLKYRGVRFYNEFESHGLQYDFSGRNLAYFLDGFLLVNGQF